MFRSTAQLNKPALPGFLTGLAFDTDPEGGSGGGGEGGEGGAPSGGAGPGEGGDGGEPKVYDQAYVDKLRNEAASYRTKLRDTEAKFEGAKTADEVEALTKELRNTISGYEADALRREIADEVELPTALASRLTGSTKEELLADAKALKDLVPKPAPSKKSGSVSGGLDPTDQPESSAPKDPGESAAKYGPRAQSMF
ncbi:hypothetical protein CLV30_106132 [Haloactinopolyspora alba]|uniref:Scaffolding protein n=1 Tax=Haloactinopolyspora alba TaxID=648780 RepID=A0A2P8E3Y1_9ACTN|nr:hypothetical protein [Haloactinopolyspora alba]PSL04127.1 hypothetical protein CLV30_106132 [Haloactinopolyspora alba]